MYMMIIGITMYSGDELVVLHAYRFHCLLACLERLSICRLLVLLPRDNRVVDRIFNPTIHVRNSQHFTPSSVTV
ncbi:Unknown protein sequence [Pseudomonas syringae pv. maculicola str. M6]|nr:Unknown protein sequence [Pseudomonas syringae pv. maculicola str. M6]